MRTRADASADRQTGAQVHHAEWLDLLARHVPDGSVDLLYADPPFNTGRTHRTPPNAGRRAGRSTKSAGERESPPTVAEFADTFASTAAFVDWLGERLTATLPKLRPAASVLIHVDWRTSHRVRVLLDDLLGERGFVNHLVWAYGLGGSSPRRFARKHDDILYYSLDPERCYFEAPRVAATSRRLAGRSKKATDVLEVPSLNNMAQERTGYPTQKPLALLRMLIRACCPPGGLVLDPVCGSGTTLVAAVQEGRRAIGGDASETAVGLSRARLAEAAGHG
jgi:DNA modification methylase